MKLVLIDDDPDIGQLLSIYCQACWPGTTVVSATKGIDGISLTETNSPDVVIVDSELPDMNGLEVCCKIRQSSDVPIIVLGASSRDTDVSNALETGADSYVVKPFNTIELLHRIRAIVRRDQKLPLWESEGSFSSGALFIDFDNREVRLSGERIKLTPIEYGLLYYLTRNSGSVQTYQTLLKNVWGEEYGRDKELLRPHIHNLRHKIGDDPQNSRIIMNISSVGYKFVKGD